MSCRVLRIILLAALLLAPLGLTRGADARPVPPLPALAWSFDIHEGRSASPHGRVFLRVNGRRVLVLPKADMQFQTVSRAEYHEKKVPAAALMACSGWWAGAGMDLYVVGRRGRLDVFLRDLDEQAPETPYRLIKSLPLPRREPGPLFQVYRRG